MCSNEILRSSPCSLYVEFSSVVQHKICCEGIFRLAAMYLIDILLSLTVEPRMKIRRCILTAQDRYIIGKLAVDSSAKAETVYFTVGLHIEAKHIGVDSRIRPRAACYRHRLIEHL